MQSRKVIAVQNANRILTSCAQNLTAHITKATTKNVPSSFVIQQWHVGFAVQATNRTTLGQPTMLCRATLKACYFQHIVRATLVEGIA